MPQSSLKVFMKFVDGEQDPRRLFSKECFEAWKESRRGNLKNPHESFRRVITAHVCGTDGRKPFPPQVERKILRVLREKKTWECFEGTEYSIGHRGFRMVGFHEQRLSKCLDGYEISRSKKRSKNVNPLKVSATSNSNSEGNEEEPQEDGETTDSVFDTASSSCSSRKSTRFSKRERTEVTQRQVNLKKSKPRTQTSSHDGHDPLKVMENMMFDCDSDESDGKWQLYPMKYEHCAEPMDYDCNKESGSDGRESNVEKENQPNRFDLSSSSALSTCGSTDEDGLDPLDLLARTGSNMSGSAQGKPKYVDSSEDDMPEPGIRLQNPTRSQNIRGVWFGSDSRKIWEQHPSLIKRLLLAFGLEQLPPPVTVSSNTVSARDQLLHVLLSYFHPRQVTNLIRANQQVGMNLINPSVLYFLSIARVDGSDCRYSSGFFLHHDQDSQWEQTSDGENPLVSGEKLIDLTNFRTIECDQGAADMLELSARELLQTPTCFAMVDAFQLWIFLLHAVPTLVKNGRVVARYRAKTLRGRPIIVRSCIVLETIQTSPGLSEKPCLYAREYLQDVTAQFPESLHTSFASIL